MKRFDRLALILLASVLSFSVAAYAQIEITLNRDFIKKYKLRATISASYTIDKAHARPNPPAKDGDIHIAGRSDDIGLATVAEIMNAATYPTAVNAVHKFEGSGQAIPVTGAWRIWCEHGGEDHHVQGQELSPFTTTNPPHIFEIHPVTSLDGHDLLASLHPIQGFEYKDAQTAFTAYERTNCEIIPAADTVTIRTEMAGYNYVRFGMQLTSQVQEVEDGAFAFADIVNPEDGDLLVRHRRMVFVKGSEPYNALEKVKNHSGDKHLTVVGIPRFDLSLVEWRVDHASDRPEALKWNLPYELIVVAIVP